MIAWLGLLLGLESTAIGSLITFGTAAIYCSFLLLATAALVARLRRTWIPAGHVRLGRTGTVVNALAVAWLAFETINIAWPRAAFAPLGAPWYQLWAAPMVVGAIAVIGLAYLVIAAPQRRLDPPAEWPPTGGRWSLMAAQLAIVGARIRTLDPARPFATALAVRGGIIVAVGGDAEVREHCDARTEVLHAGGRALVPGLVDAHLHPFWGAELARGADLSACRTAGPGACRARRRGAHPAGGLGVRLRARLRRARAAASCTAA